LLPASTRSVDKITKRYLATQALDNSEELAGKAAVRAIMLMKLEAANIMFGGATYVPLAYPVAGALSTSSVMSTLSDCPSLVPTTPGAHAPSVGAHARTGGVLSRLGELRLTSSEVTGPAINLNGKSSIGDTTPTCTKKPHCISPADMPRVVNLFDEMPEQVPVPTGGVMSFLLVNCHCR
jgi:hypothetical protein